MAREAGRTSARSGPDRDRTCDLGIKSPGGMVADCGESLKLAATATDRCCNKVHVRAASRDKPVLPLVLATVDVDGQRPDLSADLLAAKRGTGRARASAAEGPLTAPECVCVCPPEYVCPAYLLPDKPSPRNTAAKTKNTTPMPEESRVKSTIATMKNKTPARALPSACLDTSEAVTGPRLVL
jgi:hypothetical protein